MKKMLLVIMATFMSVTVPASAVPAQDITGDSQGILKKTPPTMDMDLRIVPHITKSDSGWDAILYSIDQGPRAWTA